MTVHPVPSAFEARTNAVFAAVMWALSRPGSIRDLPETGMAQVCEALIDRECAVHCTDADLSGFVARLGAQRAAADSADHLFCETVDVNLPAILRKGSDLYPEEGATLVTLVDFNQGPSLRLTGPGIDGAMTVKLGGVPSSFWQARAGATRYPMGFEMILLDGAQMMGLPRSTHVEVL